MNAIFYSLFHKSSPHFYEFLLLRIVWLLLFYLTSAHFRFGCLTSVTVANSFTFLFATLAKTGFFVETTSGLPFSLFQMGLWPDCFAWIRHCDVSLRTSNLRQKRAMFMPAFLGSIFQMHSLRLRSGVNKWFYKTSSAFGVRYWSAILAALPVFLKSVHSKQSIFPLYCTGLRHPIMQMRSSWGSDIHYVLYEMNAHKSREFLQSRMVRRRE